MISDKMCKVLNNQINAELFSSYLYLSMSSWFSERSLSGFASWMRVQAQEELSHGMKIYDYILERGGKIELGAIEQPESVWKAPVEVVELSHVDSTFILIRSSCALVTITTA